MGQFKDNVRMYPTRLTTKTWIKTQTDAQLKKRKEFSATKKYSEQRAPMRIAPYKSLPRRGVAWRSFKWFPI